MIGELKNMSQNLNSFRDIISYINSLENEEQIKEFVMSRLEKLESNSEKRKIDKNNNGRLIGTITDGYINSNSPIFSSYMVDPFYMNDATLYIEFIKSIKGKNLNNPLQFFHELQDFMIEAFGFKGNQAIRERVYLQERDDSQISIADFYKNNSALCSERSAAVQNLAEFCGIKSYLVFGKLILEGKEEEHAFNIFQMKDGTLVLYDSTNPVTLSNGFVPAYSIIGKKDISNLESILFDLEGLSKIYKQPIHPDEPLDRNYTTCNFYLNNENTKSK